MFAALSPTASAAASSAAASASVRAARSASANASASASASAAASAKVSNALLAPTEQRAPIQIVQLTSRDLQWLPALTHLLIDNVHQGATLGFLAPLSRYAALDY